MRSSTLTSSCDKAGWSCCRMKCAPWVVPRIHTQRQHTKHQHLHPAALHDSFMEQTYPGRTFIADGATIFVL